MNNVTFKGATDMGKIRTNNEDAYIAQYIWDKEHILAVAIDGVGGYDGGEVAAELARKSIIEYLENYPNGERLELLKQAVISANNTIYAERKNQPQFSNMSCVLTAALIEIKERRINMAHIGDTRLYQFANGILTKLSHDHSLVGYREEIGELTEIEAMKHPQRNIIGRDVGSRLLENGANDYVETASFPLLSKSMLLLCSDGLCDMITSGHMSSVLMSDNNVEDKASALVEAANEAGGKDNVTVVLVDVDLDDGQPLMEFTEEKIVGQEETTDQNVPSDLPDKKKWFIGVWSVILFLFGYFAGGFTSHKVLPSVFTQGNKVDTVNIESGIGQFANRDSIITFIEGYYGAIINGDGVSYFDDGDITYFDLEHTNKDVLKKRLDLEHRESSFEFDWTSMDIVLHLSSDSIVVAVYSFDLNRQNESGTTDKYHIKSEMIISSSRKIKSIKDLQTEKIESLPSTE